MTQDVRLRYLGHSTVVVDLEGVRLLTDPVLRDGIGPLRRHGRALEPDDWAGVDAVLISHMHLDHLDLPSLERLDRGVRLIVPAGAGRLVRGRGFRDVVEMRPGERTQVGPLTVTATRARHGGFRPPLGPNGESVGYVAEGSRRRAYFAGDTDIFAEMGQLGDLDVALVPVWGWGPTLGRGHLDPARAADALTLLRPRLALPIHWGTLWPRGLDRVRGSRLHTPPQEFASRAADVAPGVEVAQVPPGAREPVRL